MNIIVRFYWQHDLDLIALVKHPKFEMNVMMKKALAAYVRGEPLRVPLPPRDLCPSELDSCYIHFTLNQKKDADLIEFLKTIRYGFRNSALKMIFRNYLESYNMDVFFDDQTYLTKSRGVKRQKKKDGIAPVLKQEPKQPVLIPSPISPEPTPPPSKPAFSPKEEDKGMSENGFDLFSALDKLM